MWFTVYIILGQVCLIICLFPTCRLVIASRFHPCPVLMGLLKFLSPSRPFVVYSQYKEVSSSLVTGSSENHNNTEWALFILESSLISCHWPQVFIAWSSRGKCCYYITAADIPVNAKELQCLSRPSSYYPFCAYVAKKITVCVCVCWLVDSAVLLLMLIFHLPPLNLCSLSSNATQNSKNMAVRSASDSQTPGWDITR